MPRSACVCVIFLCSRRRRRRNEWFRLRLSFLVTSEADHELEQQKGRKDSRTATEGDVPQRFGTRETGHVRDDGSEIRRNFGGNDSFDGHTFVSRRRQATGMGKMATNEEKMYEGSTEVRREPVHSAWPTMFSGKPYSELTCNFAGRHETQRRERERGR